MAIWNPVCETLPRAELAQLQLERLQAAVNRSYKNVAFYHRRFHSLGLDPEAVQSLDDVARLPFTTKDDLQEAYPYAMLGVPLREVVRLHATTGTAGKPTVCAYTKSDLRNWTELVARVLVGGGVTKDDVVQVFFHYGLFSGAFGVHYGAEEVGASVIPASSGSTERQLTLMQDFRTTALVGNPSYALYMADVMEQLDIVPSSLALRVGLFGGEPWSEEMRRQLESRLHLTAYDNYGLSEMIGPGVAFECEARCGLHLNEDHFLAEIVDPDSETPRAAGEEGELVLTSLTKEALPLLRYRTRDLTTLLPEPCACGRTTARLARIARRCDDMIIVRGVSLYPSQVAAVLQSVEGTGARYQIVVDRPGALDEIEVAVELAPGVAADSAAALLSLQQELAKRLHAALNLTPKVRLVEPRSLEQQEGGRVIDRRAF